MNRQGVLLGFFATGAQVLLLRELVSSLNGSEVFIGTALFGWLSAVAVGAFLGGRRRSRIGANTGFVLGVILLPLIVAAVRLSPMMVTTVVGEYVSFSVAALISFLATFPLGLLSGWLFAVIVRERADDSGGITRLYFLEGLGAGVGGIVITLLVGTVLSTLSTAVVVAVLTLAGLFLIQDQRNLASVAATTVGTALIIVLAIALGPALDKTLDGIKYETYRVMRSFDTPYSHQTILEREETRVLLTDNTIEGVDPDLQAAENALLPPLAYMPEAKTILMLGHSAFGIEQLVGRIAGLSLTVVDPREELWSVRGRQEAGSNIRKIADDPVAFVQRGGNGERYDVIVLNTGDLGSYKASRLLTRRFLDAAKDMLKSNGILYLTTDYDSDRYITEGGARILAVIYNTLRESFGKVITWPGSKTAFFASDKVTLDLPYDSLVGNLSHLRYQPQYVNDNYLYDRFGEMKRERIQAAVESSQLSNEVRKPVLTHYQILYRSKLSGIDDTLASLTLGGRWWLVLLPILILAFWVIVVLRNRRQRSYGLYLYFTAGLVSLSLEMLSFYVYQAQAGSLYSEMAALVGAFMFGLSMGAYVTYRSAVRHADLIALLMLMAATVIFAVTYESVPTVMLLPYHLLFLLTTALGTGCLFAAATRRYYEPDPQKNRGIGYACELTGSVIGAMLMTTVLLPVVGMTVLLVATMGVLVLGMLGWWVAAVSG